MKIRVTAIWMDGVAARGLNSGWEETLPRQCRRCLKRLRYDTNGASVNSESGKRTRIMLTERVNNSLTTRQWQPRHRKISETMYLQRQLHSSSTIVCASEIKEEEPSCRNHLKTLAAPSPALSPGIANGFMNPRSSLCNDLKFEPRKNIGLAPVTTRLLVANGLSRFRTFHYRRLLPPRCCIGKL